MKEIDEKQSCTIKLEHKDGRTNQDITPNKVYYRMDDLRSGENIIPETEVVSITGHEVYVEIPSIKNIIEEPDTNDLEEKVISIRSEFLGGKVGTLEYHYRVRKMTYYH